MNKIPVMGPYCLVLCTPATKDPPDVQVISESPRSASHRGNCDMVPANRATTCQADLNSPAVVTFREKYMPVPDEDIRELDVLRGAAEQSKWNHLVETEGEKRR